MAKSIAAITTATNIKAMAAANAIGIPPAAWVAVVLVVIGSDVSVVSLCVGVPDSGRVVV